MPQKIAILGSTGRTGRLVVKSLLENETETESYHLHLLVRSKERLEGLIPDIQFHPRVAIDEGLPNDIAAVKSCLSEASFIVCTIGTNNNEPGISMIQDTASTIVAALDELKKEGGNTWKRPRLTLLSSASLNDQFISLRPWVLHWAVMNACNYIYADLAVAEDILLSNKSLLILTLVQPPLLLEGKRSDFTISETYVGPAVSYEDLGAAMAELCIVPEADGSIRAGVTSDPSGGMASAALQGPKNLLTGFLGRMIPGYWKLHGICFGI